MLLICADEAPPKLTSDLDANGLLWKQLSTPDDARALEPPNGWTLAIVSGSDGNGMAGWCAELRSMKCGPILVLIEGENLSRVLEAIDCDDFVCTPEHPGETFERVKRHLQIEPKPNIVSLGPLTLDTRTYQVTLELRPLDLTYMEYELLKYLVLSPGTVFTREELLRHVWGYEYFGGGRTVDVHVRRLRAKFGHEHAHLITTVRSVGYSFSVER